MKQVVVAGEHLVPDAEPTQTYNWTAGILGRLTIWPYNINYHREHHDRPDLPWNLLPASSGAGRHRHGGQLMSHLWNGALR